MKPLSPRQKSVLCQIARRAYDRLLAKGQLSGVTLDDWRHEETERAVGKAGLRECGNADYNPLLAHFESLAGEDGRAMNALLREQSDSKRQAEVVLLRELGKAGLPLAYAQAISRDKFKGRTILELDGAQAWQLVYSVKARLRAKAKHRPPRS